MGNRAMGAVFRSRDEKTFATLSSSEPLPCYLSFCPLTTCQSVLPQPRSERQYSPRTVSSGRSVEMTDRICFIVAEFLRRLSSGLPNTGNICSVRVLTIPIPKHGPGRAAGLVPNAPYPGQRLGSAAASMLGSGYSFHAS